MESMPTTGRVLTTPDAIAAGFTHRQVQWRGRSGGSWRRLARGVYSVGDSNDPLLRAEAELRSAGKEAALAGRSAALLLDMDVDAGPVELVVPPSASGRRSSARRRRVPAEHITTVDGLRTTDGLQTLLDLAAVVDDACWEWALESALHLGLTSVAAIEAALMAPGRKVRPAVARVHRVLGVRPRDAAPCESRLETCFAQLVRAQRLPEPQRQREVRDSSGASLARVDFAWTDERLLAECDGGWHDASQARRRYDRRRDAAILARTGCRVVHFDWSQVVHQPASTGRLLRQLLGR